MDSVLLCSCISELAVASSAKWLQQVSQTFLIDKDAASATSGSSRQLARYGKSWPRNSAFCDRGQDTAAAGVGGGGRERQSPSES